jgi:hypothetical protein
MAQNGKAVTRTVRLTESEARAFAEFARAEGVSEASLLRQWFVEALRRARIERATAAYRRDEVDLRDGAAMADLPIGVFVEELAARDVAMLDLPGSFERGMDALRSAFGGQTHDDTDQPAGTDVSAGRRMRSPRRTSARSA